MANLLKRFFKKSNMKKMCRGSISLFLVMIMSPILTVAGVLVEATRVQEMHSYNQAAIDSAALSTLANYDPYLEERFGLFAFDQREKPEVKFHDYLIRNLEENNEKQSLFGTGSASGNFVLAKDEPKDVFHELFGINDEYQALEQQITDFSQTTEMVNTIFELADLEGLLDQLSEAIGLDKLIDAVDTVTRFINSAKDFAKDIKDLEEGIFKLPDTIQDVKKKQGKLENAIRALRSRLDADQIEINSEMLKDDSDFWNLLETEEEYQKLINDLFSAIDQFYQALVVLKNDTSAVLKTLGSLTEHISDFAGAYASTFNYLPDTGVDLYKHSTDLLNDESEIQTKYEEKQGELNSKLKGALLEFVERSINNFNSLRGDMDGFYVRFPLDSTSIKSLRLILSCFISRDVKESVKAVLVALDFDLSFENVTNFLIEEADAIIDGIKNLVTISIEKLVEFFKHIKAVIESIFNFVGIYDGNLHAIIGGEEVKHMIGTGGPYAKFVESLACAVRATTLLTRAVEKYAKAMQLSMVPVVGVFMAIVETVDGTIDFAEGAVTLVDSVHASLEITNEIAKHIIVNAADAIKMFANGKPVRSLYEKLLLCSYIVDNIPNRTTDFSKEESLTGYSYKELAKRSGLDDQFLLQPAAATVSFFELLVQMAGDDEVGTLSKKIKELKGNKSSGVIEKVSDQVEKNCFMGAEAEYFIGGTKYEVMNQIAAFIDIYTIRLVADIVPVLTNPEVQEMCAEGGPFFWIGEIFFILAEPLADMVVLVNGGSIPPIKLNGDVYLTASGLPGYLVKLGKCVIKPSLKKDFEDTAKDALTKKVDASKYAQYKAKDGTKTLNGPDWEYKNYLFLAILLGNNNTEVMRRLTDIINMETRQYYRSTDGKTDFWLNNAYVTINFKANFKPNFIVDEWFGNQLWKFEQERGY